MKVRLFLSVIVIALLLLLSFGVILSAQNFSARRVVNSAGILLITVGMCSILIGLSIKLVKQSANYFVNISKFLLWLYIPFLISILVQLGGQWHEYKNVIAAVLFNAILFILIVTIFLAKRLVETSIVLPKQRNIYQAAKKFIIACWLILASILLNQNIFILGLHYAKATLLDNATSAYLLAKHYDSVKEHSPSTQADAFNWYQKAYLLGHSEAIPVVAAAYYEGVGTQKNYQLAFTAYKELESKHRLDAEPVVLFRLAEMYRRGHGVASDFEMALFYYQRAYQGGDIEAAYQASSLAHSLKYPTRNDELLKSFTLNEMIDFRDDMYRTFAARNGHFYAMNESNFSYYAGALDNDAIMGKRSAQSLYNEGEKYYLESARYIGADYLYSQTDFSKSYLVNYDFMQSFNYFRKAAKAGNSQAKKRLLEMDINGRGFDFFSKDKAERGQEINALIDIIKGEFVGFVEYFRAKQKLNKMVEKQNKELLKSSIALLNSAIDKGYSYADYELAHLYYRGKLIERNVHKARELFMQASVKGVVEADYFLGRIYEIGEGVKADKELAESYYLKAAKNKVIDARFALAVLYQERDATSAAAGWYKSIYHMGHAHSAFNHGIISYNTIKAANTKEYYLTLESFLSAIVAEIPQAYFNLAMVLLEYSTSESRFERAEYYLLAAASKGDKQAKVVLGNLYKNTTFGADKKHLAQFWLAQVKGTAEEFEQAYAINSKIIRHIEKAKQ